MCAGADVRVILVFTRLCLASQLTLIHNDVAAALVPHYPRLLPYFNKHKQLPGVCLASDAIDYGQNDKKKVVLSDLVARVLRALEETGGPAALQAIKSSLPCHESHS